MLFFSRWGYFHSIYEGQILIFKHLFPKILPTGYCLEVKIKFPLTPGNFINMATLGFLAAVQMWTVTVVFAIILKFSLLVYSHRGIPGLLTKVEPCLGFSR